MAKPGLPKKKRGPSVHSRAARRATSPGIDADKSTKEAGPPREREAVQPSVLAARQGAGVSKKVTKRKAVASARARRKHDRGVGMAEAVLERTSTKVERSVMQAKAMKVRSKTWEEVNTALDGGLVGGERGAKNAFAALGGGDEEEEDVEVEEEAPLKAVVPQIVYEGVQEDEEIL